MPTNGCCSSERKHKKYTVPANHTLFFQATAKPLLQTNQEIIQNTMKHNKKNATFQCEMILFAITIYSKNSNAL
jgi:hypothetical protein